MIIFLVLHFKFSNNAEVYSKALHKQTMSYMTESSYTASRKWEYQVSHIEGWCIWARQTNQFWMALVLWKLFAMLAPLCTMHVLSCGLRWGQQLSALRHMDIIIFGAESLWLFLYAQMLPNSMWPNSVEPSSGSSCLHMIRILIAGLFADEAIVTFYLSWSDPFSGNGLTDANRWNSIGLWFVRGDTMMCWKHEAN